MSLRNEGRGFLVSELIEAYDRNVPGGASGLFNVVLSANLEQIPSNILRNYALEGKSPIHLDRHRVEEMGSRPSRPACFRRITCNWPWSFTTTHGNSHWRSAPCFGQDSNLVPGPGRQKPARSEPTIRRRAKAATIGHGLLCDHVAAIRQALCG